MASIMMEIFPKCFLWFTHAIDIYNVVSSFFFPLKIMMKIFYWVGQKFRSGFSVGSYKNSNEPFCQPNTYILNPLYLSCINNRLFNMNESIVGHFYQFYENSHVKWILASRCHFFSLSAMIISCILHLFEKRALGSQWNSQKRAYVYTQNF